MTDYFFDDLNERWEKFRKDWIEAVSAFGDITIAIMEVLEKSGLVEIINQLEESQYYPDDFYQTEIDHYLGVFDDQLPPL